MDRSAICLFGIRNYGVSVTGYLQHPTKGLCIWLQQRSFTKQTWPGMYRNCNQHNFMALYLSDYNFMALFFYTFTTVNAFRHHTNRTSIVFDLLAMSVLIVVDNHVAYSLVYM